MRVVCVRPAPSAMHARAGILVRAWYLFIDLNNMRDRCRLSRGKRCLQPPRRRSRCSNVVARNMTSLGTILMSLSYTSHSAHRGPIAVAAAAAFLPHHPSACTLPSNSGYVPGGIHNRNHRLLVEVRLQAKKSRGGRRQKSSRGGRGRRQKDQQVEEDDATNTININGVSRSVPAVPPPKSYRRSTLRIRPLQTLAPPQAPASSSRLHIDIAMFDIDDADWWEAKTLLQEAGERQRGAGGDITSSQASDNPFGTRAWPPSLVVAQLLAGLQPSDINRRPIVELGCGTGLVSLTAAGLGANAIATDISPLVLELTRRGWKETMTGLQKAGRRSNDAEVGTL